LVSNINDLCSADLFDNKYTVPCDPVQFLNEAYGVNGWQTPEAKDYKWNNIIDEGEWSLNDWKDAYRLYNSDGEIQINETLKYLNSRIKPEEHYFNDNIFKLN
jgi:hypothetical protein